MAASDTKNLDVRTGGDGRLGRATDEAPLRPSSEFQPARVTAADANGHTVALLADDGTETATTFERVHGAPDATATFSVGDDVLLWFRPGRQHPSIFSGAGGGGGGTTTVLTASLCYFTTG